jgi:CheY-like chemotaxis protein
MSRVLVVDDDPNLRQLVTVRLEKAGHRVRGADSAAEALALVADRGAPDVVVLDVTMPGMTGLELLPAMRALDGCAELPAIFLSGRVEPHDVEAGRALNATYLTKPFSAHALTKAIERLAPVEAGW